MYICPFCGSTKREKPCKSCLSTNDEREGGKMKELKSTGGTLLPKDINGTIRQIIEFKTH